MLGVHLKTIPRLDRLRLRGLSGASDGSTQAAAVQNQRRLAPEVQRKSVSKGLKRTCPRPISTESAQTRQLSQ